MTVHIKPARQAIERGDTPGLQMSTVILAAGLSARMGHTPKLLLDIGGAPMIRRTVENALAFSPVETIVVTGHRAPEIEAALGGLPVSFIHNPSYGAGQPTSVAAGVAALNADCHAVMIMLGDQPLVTADHLRALASAYAALDGASILVPYHNSRRGNPVIVGTQNIPEMVGRGVNIGCRHLIDTHVDRVWRSDMSSDVYTFDCDTPEDYRRLLRRIERAES